MIRFLFIYSGFKFWVNSACYVHALPHTHTHTDGGDIYVRRERARERKRETRGMSYREIKVKGEKWREREREIKEKGEKWRDELM